MINKIIQIIFDVIFGAWIWKFFSGTMQLTGNVFVMMILLVMAVVIKFIEFHFKLQDSLAEEIISNLKQIPFVMGIGIVAWFVFTNMIPLSGENFMYAILVTMAIFGEFCKIVGIQLEVKKAK